MALLFSQALHPAVVSLNLSLIMPNVGQGGIIFFSCTIPTHTINLILRTLNLFLQLSQFFLKLEQFKIIDDDFFLAFTNLNCECVKEW